MRTLVRSKCGGGCVRLGRAGSAEDSLTRPAALSSGPGANPRGAGRRSPGLALPSAGALRV